MLYATEGLARVDASLNFRWAVKNTFQIFQIQNQLFGFHYYCIQR
jgi:hypothetical protein